MKLKDCKRTFYVKIGHKFKGEETMEISMNLSLSLSVYPMQGAFMFFNGQSSNGINKFKSATKLERPTFICLQKTKAKENRTAVIPKKNLQLREKSSIKFNYITSMILFDFAMKQFFFKIKTKINYLCWFVYFFLFYEKNLNAV